MIYRLPWASLLIFIPGPDQTDIKYAFFLPDLTTYHYVDLSGISSPRRMRFSANTCPVPCAISYYILTSHGHDLFQLPLIGVSMLYPDFRTPIAEPESNSCTRDDSDLNYLIIAFSRGDILYAAEVPNIVITFATTFLNTLQHLALAAPHISSTLRKYATTNPIMATPSSGHWGIDQSITCGSTTILSSTAGIIDTGTNSLVISSGVYLECSE
ncbi:hypothetical protein BDR04DRAFT_1159987 [Suillus decipiens]|nr:hypothetical protein BDR04DRAFT_1159987 [Suillus decipiens]